MAEPYAIYLSSGRTVYGVGALPEVFAALRAASPIMLMVVPTSPDGQPGEGGVEAIRSDHIVSVRVPQSMIDELVPEGGGDVHP